MHFRLIAKMHDRKISLADLANQLNLSNAQLCRKLCGMKAFTWKEIEIVLRTFSPLTFAQLFPQEEDNHDEKSNR